MIVAPLFWLTEPPVTSSRLGTLVVSMVIGDSISIVPGYGRRAIDFPVANLQLPAEMCRDRTARSSVPGAAFRSQYQARSSSTG